MASYIDCIVQGGEFICDKQVINGGGEITVRAIFDEGWAGCRIFLSFVVTRGGQSQSGQIEFKKEEDISEYLSCADFFEFGFIGVDDESNVTNNTNVKCIRIDDGAYIVNPGVTANDLTFAWRLNAAETAISSHKEKRDNPHSVTAGQVGAYTKGEVDEVISLHEERRDNPHSVTAGQVGAYTKGEVDEVISLHEERRDNPHSVTAGQVGAYTKGEVDNAIFAAFSSPLIMKNASVAAEDIDKAISPNVVYDFEGCEAFGRSKVFILPSPYALSAAVPGAAGGTTSECLQYAFEYTGRLFMRSVTITTGDPGIGGDVATYGDWMELRPDADLSGYLTRAEFNSFASESEKKVQSLKGDFADALTQAEGETGKVKRDLSLHSEQSDNPHSVTAGQVGAYTKGEVDEVVSGIYRKAESDKLVGACEITFNGGIAMKGNVLPEISGEYVYLSRFTSADGSPLTNEGDEVILDKTVSRNGQYFGYVAAKDVYEKYGNGQYCLVVDLTILTNSKNVSVGGWYRPKGGTYANDTSAKVIVGQMTPSSYGDRMQIFYPFTAVEGNGLEGIHMSTSEAIEVTLTLNDVRLYKGTVARGIYTDFNDGGKLLNGTHLKCGEDTVRYYGAIEEPLCINTFNNASIYHAYSSSTETEEVVVYKPLEQKFPTLEAFNALSGIVSSKGITYESYAAGEKCILEKGCFYYLRNNSSSNKTFDWYKQDGTKLADGDGNDLASFKEAFVITTSNNYQGSHMNIALIPSTLSITSKAFYIDVNYPDIYVLSSSDRLSVWKVKA